VTAAYDGQRRKVYAAEERLRVWSDTQDVSVESIQLTLTECQEFCDLICEMENVPKVKVRKRQGNRVTHYQSIDGVIAVAMTWGNRESVLLHELAHHIMTVRHGYERYQRIPAHGSEFAGTFLHLLGYYLPPLGSQLRKYYRQLGARVDAFTKVADGEARSIKMGLGFGDIRVGQTYMLGLGCQPKFRGIEVEVIKKNRTKVVVMGNFDGFYLPQRVTVPPALLEERES
jgi:putative metallohydrolase (TIGR04338 family)